MKNHSVLGFHTIERAMRELEHGSEFLRVAAEVALSHHERWDGAGYPQGLAGTAIPVSARIMAIADVYDALSSVRVYKPAFRHLESLAMMRDGPGDAFDPALMECFLEVETEIATIAQALVD